MNKLSAPVNTTDLVILDAANVPESFKIPSERLLEIEKGFERFQDFMKKQDSATVPEAFAVANLKLETAEELVFVGYILGRMIAAAESNPMSQLMRMMGE